MGVLTDFFVATEDERARAFRGWTKPAPLLDEFIVIQVKNPFTGAMSTKRTRVPPGCHEPEPDAVASGNFHDLPWIAQKGISTVEVARLAEVVMDWDRDNARSEIEGRFYAGPPDTEQSLNELPVPFVARLAASSPEQCSTFGARWAEMVRADAGTIKSPTIRESQQSRPDSEFVERVSELVKLARTATESGRGMYMWMCP
jgi:hypothetical protein